MQSDHQHPEPEHGAFVHIIINGTTFEIHRGREAVAAIKQVGGVPAAYDLDQVVDGKLVPLPDDGSVTIKGGEQFVSHPKDSGSA